MEVVARRSGGLLQSKVRISAPAEVAGTAFLMREVKGGASEQYLYSPGLRRTRRIEGKQNEGSFMNSDFAYADMQRIDPKFTRNTRLPDEPVGKDDAFVIETQIKPESGSLYGKLTTWVRKKDFVALRTRFFDKQGKPVKTLYAREVKQVEGKPVVVKALMQSENKHSTELVIDSMERNDALPDSLFTPAALEHD
jgi:outer membrane lipoprotein-sorting protein